MVQMPQIGRKLAARRREHQWIKKTIDAATQVQATSSSNVRTAQTPVRIIEDTASQPVSEYEATTALFQQWKDEAAQMTPEQQAAEDAVWNSVMKNLPTNRKRLTWRVLCG